MQGDIVLLDARIAEDLLLALKVPGSAVIYINADGKCFWSSLSVFLDAANLPPQSPEAIMRSTAEVLLAVNTQDDFCKCSCYFAQRWLV
jgi:hypothetical protein